MATIVLTTRPVMELACGYDLRVVNLCRQMRDTLHLVVVQLGDVLDVEARIDRDAVFESITEFRLQAEDRPSWKRHFRTEEGAFLPLAFPARFGELVHDIQQIAKARSADRMVVFGSELAGLARATGFARVLFDVCDCISLTMVRRAAHNGGRETFRERLQRWRWQRTEAHLPSWFRHVTTINDADSEQLRRLSGTPALNVHTVPNGVGEQFITNRRPQFTVRGVAFWGNLPFGPNRDAIRYFMDHIYRPYLEGRDVEVCIIGRGPDPWLVDWAAKDPHVKLLGFVDDLTAVASRYAVMINPMRTGSGMKNKVLEAFAMGLGVVSTSLGMEAFPDARSGVHCLVHDAPEQFAASVLRLLDDHELRHRITAEAQRLVLARYRWEAIGEQWNALLDAA
jgi:hypothetical protein